MQGCIMFRNVFFIPGNWSISFREFCVIFNAKVHFLPGFTKCAYFIPRSRYSAIGTLYTPAFMIKVVPPNFFPNIWGSPAFKFRVHPKMVHHNVSYQNVKAGEPQILGKKFWGTTLIIKKLLGVILSHI